MQSQIDSDTEEHTCLGSIKRTVMGCCYSLCHKDTHQEDQFVNERTVLLSAPEETPPPRVPLPTHTPRKPDEQSALSRILQEAANNVIDVGALGTHNLESHEYTERVRAYQARLATAPTTINCVATLCLLKDIPQGLKNSILASSPIDQKDIDMINNAVARAATAVSELRVDHREDLVVPFRIP